MGAHNYSRGITVKPSVKIRDAYDMACREDEDETGSDPYSGDIKQSCGFVELTFKKGTRKSTKIKAMRAAAWDEDDDRFEKRGSCAAVDLGLVKIDGHWYRQYAFAGWAAE